MADFPTALTNAVDGTTDVLAKHINNIEAKIGIDGSAVTTSHDYKLSTVTSTQKAVSTGGAQTVAGLKTFSDGIETDTIAEDSAGSGVTIDGVLIKDSLDTSGIVTKSTAQTISGVKTLSAGMLFTEQSAPSTPSANDIHLYAKDDGGTSALYVKDDGGTETKLGSSNTASARVYKSSAQTISNNSLTALSFDSEHYDTNTLHDTSTDNSRITAHAAGKWLINGIVTYSNNSTGARSLHIYKNGSSQAYVETDAADGRPTGVCISLVLDLAANDYIELYSRQTSGGNLDTGSGTTEVTFDAIGPLMS